MADQTIKINIPFEALLDSIAELSVDEKLRLRDSLDEQIATLEEHPETEAEVREARRAYERGDYTTIDEYMGRR